jgi:uncharacterized protein YdhG (YjbR/CyaY superfamily)
MEATSGIKFRNVEEYLSAFPKNISSILEKMRETIKKAAPDAEELISYNMPAFRLKGMLVYYAAHKNHIGFYPTSSGISAFKKELSAFEGSKGSVRFPMHEPLPLKLITEIVKFRVKENLERERARSGQKK